MICLVLLGAATVPVGATTLACIGGPGCVAATDHELQFTGFLDWQHALGVADGIPHEPTWEASGTGLQVTLGSGGDLRRTDNVLRGVRSLFLGHFELGDHLVGISGPGSFILLVFDQDITDLGFRVAAAQTAGFNFTMQAFGDMTGSGTPIFDNAWTGLTGGGVCSTLHSNVACDDAPFVGFTGASGVRSLLLTSSDPNGFFIDSLHYNLLGSDPGGDPPGGDPPGGDPPGGDPPGGDPPGGDPPGNDPLNAVPEPGTWVLVGAGLAAIVWKRSR